MSSLPKKTKKIQQKHSQQELEELGSKAIEVVDIHKSFKVGDQYVEVLRGINFEVLIGGFALVVGPSGCGKSTLLHTILGLEPPSSGKVFFFGKDLYHDSTEDSRSLFRKKHIGMVYQQPNWIKALNVVENISFPLTLLGVGKVEAISEAYKILDQVGMEGWANYIPTELSSGQQQRISLARALVHYPEVIIADEPTGNLDYKSGQRIMDMLSGLTKEQRKTVVMVTHDLEYIRYADTVIQMLDGQIVSVYHGDDKNKALAELMAKKGYGIEKEVSEFKDVSDSK